MQNDEKIDAKSVSGGSGRLGPTQGRSGLRPARPRDAKWGRLSHQVGRLGCQIGGSGRQLGRLERQVGPVGLPLGAC